MKKLMAGGLILLMVALYIVVGIGTMA